MEQAAQYLSNCIMEKVLETSELPLINIKLDIELLEDYDVTVFKIRKRSIFRKVNHIDMGAVFLFIVKFLDANNISWECPSKSIFSKRADVDTIIAKGISDPDVLSFMIRST